jgi:hypothetical protein
MINTRQEEHKHEDSSDSEDDEDISMLLGEGDKKYESSKKEGVSVMQRWMLEVKEEDIRGKEEDQKRYKEYLSWQTNSDSN